jgi:hypothetical protein
MSCAAPAQQQPTEPVALMHHRMSMKIASAKAKRKKSQSHGSKEQAVIDSEIYFQNYCHKKFRKVSYSSFENSDIYKLNVFGPLTKRGWADTVVGLLPP